MIEVVDKWRLYLERRGVLIDVSRADRLLAVTRKEIRSSKRSGNVVDKSLSYRVSSLESLVMSSSEYLSGDYLDISSFLRDHHGQLLRVYPKYALTDTFRLYTSNPCVGNLDGSLRDVIVPERGNFFVSLDFKHQEPWIIINLLESVELMDILEGNEDFYLGILKRFDVEETKENRDIAKIVWNSSIYGSSLDSLSVGEIEWVRQVYYWINGIKEVRSLRRKVERNLKYGKTMYTKFGFERRVDHKDYGSVNRAFNSIFQMSGAGVLYAGLETINNAVVSKDMGDKIQVHLTNHDEYLLEVSDEVEVVELVRFMSGIVFEIEGWTRPRYELLVGDSWGSLKKID